MVFPHSGVRAPQQRKAQHHFPNHSHIFVTLVRLSVMMMMTMVILFFNAGHIIQNLVFARLIQDVVCYASG